MAVVSRQLRSPSPPKSISIERVERWGLRVVAQLKSRVVLMRKFLAHVTLKRCRQRKKMSILATVESHMAPQSALGRHQEDFQNRGPHTDARRGSADVGKFILVFWYLTNILADRRARS